MNWNGYLLEESKHVQARLLEWTKEVFVLERIGLTFTGAVWGWCGTHLELEPMWVPLMVPCILAVFLAWRSRGVYGDIRLAEKYLLSIEQTVLNELSSENRSGEFEVRGWQDFKVKHRSPFRAFAAFVFWIALILLTGIVAVLSYSFVGSRIDLVTAGGGVLLLFLIFGFLEILVWHVMPRIWIVIIRLLEQFQDSKDRNDAARRSDRKARRKEERIE